MEEEQVKKESFFQKIQKSKKKQVLFFVVSMAVMVGIYLYISPLLEKKMLQQVRIIEDDFSWIYQVEKIEEKNTQLVIEGWAFRLNVDATGRKFEVVLRDTESGEVYPTKMSYSIRNDVNNYFLCSYDYSRCGFQAEIPLSNIEKESNYEVMLHLIGKKEMYSTNIYYVNGKMQFVNPDGYVPLYVTGTDLEPIVEDGILRVYRPDFGMYVYQYNGELYWIAEEGYEFTNGDTFIQYQLNTTQVDRLPEERLENNWYWDNIGFQFSKNELVDWNTGQYRVTKCRVPTEYSIINIWTGRHADDWIWIQYFRPYYEFN